MIYTLLILSLLSVTLAQKNCSHIIDLSGSGKYYNIGEIVGREFTWKDSFSDYKVSLCNDSYPNCGQCGGPAGFCQSTTFWDDCIGRFSSAQGFLRNGKEGVELIYDGGDFGNVGIVRIECDPTVNVTGPIDVSKPKNITLYSKYACLPSPPPPPPPPRSECTRILDSNGSGAFYNLSRIIGQQLFWNVQSFSNFKASICVDSYSDCGACGGPAGFCQYTNTWADCVGKFSMAVGLAGTEGVELFYDDGDWGHSGRIRIDCDPTVELSTPTYGSNPFHVRVSSKHACLCQWVCVPY